MEPLPYTIRNYKPQDFDEVLSLYIEAEKYDPAGRPACAEELKEKFRHPSYLPERDLFLAELEGSFIAYLDMIPETGIGRVVLDCWIHPAHRGKGLAKALLGYGAQRARRLGAEKAHVNVQKEKIAERNVLQHLGFEHVRTFLELTLDLSGFPAEDIQAYGCRYLQSGEEGMLTDIQNRSFTGSWGYNPNTIDTIAYRLNLSHSSPGDVVVACQGREILAYCWTEVPAGNRLGTNQQKGRVYMIGTAPDVRGRGLGKRVLLAGLSHLKQRGAKECELTVDSQNETARRLYNSLGFRFQYSTLWYEMPL